MNKVRVLFIVALGIAAAPTQAKTASTTISASATVVSFAAVESGPGYVEFTSNDPDAGFLIGDQPVLAGTYALELDGPTRMADGWRPLGDPPTERLARQESPRPLPLHATASAAPRAGRRRPPSTP